MNGRLKLICFVACALALAGCRHHQTVAPVVAPTAEVKAPPPAERVEPAANDFKPATPAAAVEDLGDAAHATALAEQRGWIRDAFFDFDSSALGPDARTNLSDSAHWIEKHPKFHLLVEGHCDERGTEQYNLALGERRAFEAKSYLAILGINPEHIATISYGKDRPFETGHDEEAWAQNRRAHLVLTSQ